MKRFFLLTVGIFIVTGAAVAQTQLAHWSDPNECLSFDYPTNWILTPQSTQTPGMIWMFTGQGDFGCQV